MVSPPHSKPVRGLAGVVAAIALATSLVVLTPVAATAETRPITFPVLGGASWTDTFGAPRSGGRSHAGQDLSAPKMRSVVATVDATVVRVGRDQGSLSGNYVVIEDAQGWEYLYMHLNNDTPGTDDGANRDLEALLPGIRVGRKVWAGQVLGYLGDSGNAEATAPHLHFEIRSPSGIAVNATDSLRAANHVAINDQVAAAHSPRGNFEGLQLAPGGGRMTGWAFDPDTFNPIGISLYSNKRLIGDVKADQFRWDLAQDLWVFGGSHAFAAPIALPLGRTDVCAFGLNDDRGSAGPIGCQSLTVPAGQLGSVDHVERVPEGLRISGWTIDPDTTGSLDVYLSNGAVSVYAKADLGRPDVGQAYPAYGPAHGYSVILPVGPAPTYFCVTGINVGRGASSHIRCATA